MPNCQCYFIWPSGTPLGYEIRLRPQCSTMLTQVPWRVINQAPALMLQCISWYDIWGSKASAMPMRARIMQKVYLQLTGSLATAGMASPARERIPSTILHTSALTIECPTHTPVKNSLAAAAPSLYIQNICAHCRKQTSCAAPRMGDGIHESARVGASPSRASHRSAKNCDMERAVASAL